MSKSKSYNKECSNKIPMSNTSFQKIVQFYLFECPAEGRSTRGKSLAEYGWKGRWPLATLEKRLLAASVGNLEDHFFPGKPKDLSGEFTRVEKVSPCNEYCVFLSNEAKSVMQSLFASIRNAFAHGSFSVRKYKGADGTYQRMYFIRNYDGYLKAEMILNERTLLAWIDIIINGP